MCVRSFNVLKIAVFEKQVIFQKYKTTLRQTIKSRKCYTDFLVPKVIPYHTLM